MRMVDFDPGIAGMSITAAGAGRNSFVLKMSECKPNSVNDVITACDRYKWIDGNTYTVSNNSATHILTNSVYLQTDKAC